MWEGTVSHRPLETTALIPLQLPSDRTPVPAESEINFLCFGWNPVSLWHGQQVSLWKLTPMKKLRCLVSLTTRDNDYQIEQATSAEEAARRLAIELQIIYAENDAITQSQQLLKIIQSNSTDS